MLAPPDSSSGGTSSIRRPSVISSTGSLRPPPPVRADTNFMIPSDSDDDAPKGGYYVHQGDPVSVVRRRTVSTTKSGRRPSAESPSTGLGIALATDPSHRTVSEQNPKLMMVNNPPLQPGANLGRRRTAPSRRSQHDEERFFGRRRTTKRSAVVHEAP